MLLKIACLLRVLLRQETHSSFPETPARPLNTVTSYSHIIIIKGSLCPISQTHFNSIREYIHFPQSPVPPPPPPHPKKRGGGGGGGAWSSRLVWILWEQWRLSSCKFERTPLTRSTSPREKSLQPRPNKHQFSSSYTFQFCFLSFIHLSCPCK